MMLTAVLVIATMAGTFGLLLGYTAIRFRVEGNPMVDQIDNLLPQTQCGQCGYPGCRPYAEALAAEQAQINQCPPGGEAGMLALADLLGRDPLSMQDTEASQEPESVAWIDETLCIGCTLCLKACPVDAILGSAKQMHTVITSECTGCKLCIAPCPVECIEMRAVKQDPSSWRSPYPGSLEETIRIPGRLA